jgi:hypothetical protein
VEGLGAAVRDDERARVHRVDQGTMQGNAAAASVRHLRLVSAIEERVSERQVATLSELRAVLCRASCLLLTPA